MASRPDDDAVGGPPDWAGLVVPDDISELEAEVTALRRERAQAAPPRSLLRGIVETRRWRRYGLSGPLLVIVLMVVLLFASLVFLLLPASPRSPRVRPLAHPRAPVGQPGALLPDLALTAGMTGAIRLRNVRPAVVLLLPGSCRCGPLVADVLDSTSSPRLPVLLVGEGTDPVLPSTAPTSRVHSGTDPAGRMATTFGLADRPIAVFVRSDGTVSRILRDATAGAELHDELAALAG